jgi:hypothetical protein
MPETLSCHATNKHASDVRNQQGNVDRKTSRGWVVPVSRYVSLVITNLAQHISRGRPIFSQYYTRNIVCNTARCHMRECRQELSQIPEAVGLGRRRSRHKRVLHPFTRIVHEPSIRFKLERTHLELSSVETTRRRVSVHGALQRQLLACGAHKHSQLRLRTKRLEKQPEDYISMSRSRIQGNTMLDRRNK